jgi:oligoribonuclease
VESCALLEIAVLVTDGRLERVLEGPDLVIHQSEAVLAGMNEWCVSHHGKSGLTERVRSSKVSLQEAEEAVLSFVARHTVAGHAQLAGNSVHCDLGFLRRYMPRLAAHLHYRIVDVSSVRELAKRWYPAEMRKAPRKACEHTAKADILESLDELRWLRRTVFKPVR